MIDGAEIKSKADLSGPHTVHCLGSEIIISFLGNAKGEAPGGYLHLNKDFEIVGRWENTMGDIKFGYDFWYQPRHNVMVSSEWAAPILSCRALIWKKLGILNTGVSSIYGILKSANRLRVSISARMACSHLRSSSTITLTAPTVFAGSIELQRHPLVERRCGQMAVGEDH